MLFSLSSRIFQRSSLRRCNNQVGRLVVPSLFAYVNVRPAAPQHPVGDVPRTKHSRRLTNVRIPINRFGTPSSPRDSGGWRDDTDSGESELPLLFFLYFDRAGVHRAAVLDIRGGVLRPSRKFRNVDRRSAALYGLACGRAGTFREMWLDGALAIFVDQLSSRHREIA